MRLSMEEVKLLKKNITDCTDIDTCKHISNGNVVCSNALYCKRVLNLCDTIEALQQELKDAQANYKTAHDNALWLDNKRKELQQENEQLQAQVAQYREALIIANHRMPDVGQFCACGKCKTCGADINYVGYEYCVKCARVIIDEALSDTPVDYHNPADVEALRKAREALGTCMNTFEMFVLNKPMENAKVDIREALAAISEAIGGKEDV